MRVLQTLLSIVLISTTNSHSVERRESSEKRVVCYYTNWSVYRPGTAKYNPQNINPYLCTHLIYAFGGLDRENGLRPYDKYQDIEQGGYAKFTGLKSYNKNLKTMLAIGGWNEGSARFSPLVADEERRKEFVKNVVKFLRVNHFDGLDLDWEYPAFRDGGKPRDRDNYAQLVQELREEFDREHDKTGRPRLLLTMAVPAGIEYIDKGYDVPKLNRYLDFMNILSYDYHSAFEPAVNHHSPLFPLEEDNEYNFDAQLSIDYTVKHYLKAGADRDKLVLGIPTYGRSYTLFNPESTDIGAPADGPGEQGDATREKGYLAYYEICGALKGQDDWTIVQPKPGAMGPYAYRNNQWVGYDDVDIVKEKANYVNDQGLGGIMFWSIDNDDFRGKCHDRAYPLIEAAKEALYASSAPINNLVSSSNKKEKGTSLTNLRKPKPTKPKTPRTTSTTVAPSKTTAGQTTPEPPTTPDPGSDFVCKDEGFFPHPRDCKKYFWCLDSGPSNLGIVAHQFTCPSGLFFNKAADSCDYTRNVLCNKKERESKTTTIRPKVTAATSKTTVGRVFSTTTTTTTTTTTEAPEEEEFEEEEEHEQEDPEAIKQLIQLIKKLGGVAELEKQLEGAGATGVSTPAIPRSLYNKVLTPQRPKYKSPFRNGPSGPQNEGLSQKDDGASYRREKPQYVTIRRERPSTEAPEEELVEIVTPSSPSKYTNIVRNRPVNQYEVEEPEEEEIIVRPVATSPRYQTIERSRPVRPEPEPEEVVEEEPFRPKYSTIQRGRPTTIEAIVENTTPRYVTLRRERPQVEQQLEESTIKHTGETIVIEGEEEIKPIEIDVEEPISTSIRPKLKVSEIPVFGVNGTTREPFTGSTISTTRAEVTSEVPLTVAPEPSSTPVITTEGVTVTKESVTESSSQQPTTVPYQTSTLTSIVTVVVEGATERKRVPLTKLKQALADHDLLANSVAGDKKYVSGKSSVVSKDKSEEKDTDKPDEINRYRPLGNYRGRTRKPIIVEPPTTKALPLYLQRRRTTTEKSLNDFDQTEDPELTTKTRTFGRFTPTRTRERTRGRPSSTVPTDEVEVSTPRTNRYRTSRPSVGGSRFASSKGRNRSTTEAPDTDIPLDDVTGRKSVGNKEDTASESSRSENKGRRRYGNRKETTTEVTSEKPSRLFTRGKTRSTTEKPSANENSSTTRSRFVINRGRNRASNSTTPKTLGNEVTEKDPSTYQSSPAGVGGSRFQIQRRRKYKTDSETASNDLLKNNTETINRNNTEEEHEIMISQENSSLKPSQIFNSSIATPLTVTENVELTTLSNNLVNSSAPVKVEEEAGDVFVTNQTTSKQGIEELDSLISNNANLSLVDSNNETLIGMNTTLNNDSLIFKTNSSLLKGGFLNNTKETVNDTMPVLVSDFTKENDSFVDNEAEGEVLDVFASRYSEQPFTGRRGSTRFQGQSKNQEQESYNNLIDDNNKKNISRQTRRKKVNTNDIDLEGNIVSKKSDDESNNSSRRRKVLVRKNKVTSATEESLYSTTETVIRNPSRSRLPQGRNNNSSKSRNLAKNSTLIQSTLPRSRNSRTRQSTEKSTQEEVLIGEDFQKINLRARNQEENKEADIKRRKVKVLKSRHQVNALEDDIHSNPEVHRRRVVVKKKVKDNENNNEEVPRKISTRRGQNKFSDKDLRDLDTGTSLYVQRETESDDASRNSFTRSVNKQTLQNALVKDAKSRGKIKAKDSLLDDITGVTEGEEDYNDDPTDITEVGGNRVRGGFRRPSPTTSRSRLSTTTEPATVEPDRPAAKFYRRRVNKVRAGARNTTAFPSSAATSPPQGLYETTAKQRRFEFPRRSGKPNVNGLPQQAALVASSTPFVEIEDNHSDESLHEVDTETVESKEVYEGLEDSTLPDLANVAVAAIQSLATVPPSTETLPPATSPTPRRQSVRLTTTTTTTVRPTVNSRRGPPRPFSKVRPATSSTPRSQYISKHKPYDDLAPEYEDYYAEPVEVPLSGKVRIHNDGYIECLDIGNFPHPFACKKFISCAKMENGHLLGWEYTCPKGLSFDPIGGICNWSAGLGCKE